MQNLSPKLTAAAGNYACVYHQIWPGEMSPWQLAVIFIANVEIFSSVFTFMLTLFFINLGALEPSGQASKLYFFTMLRLAMNVALPFFATPPACLIVRQRPAIHMLPAPCLYAVGLPQLLSS
jgi:hypothetical protein